MELGRRILVLGSAGSGKSTLAAAIGTATGLSVVHLDRLFWNPGWVETAADEMDRRVAEAAAGESWIIDGNYLRSLPLRLERCDSVVFIDLGRLVCLYRIIKRRIVFHGKARSDMGEGCVEKIDWEFVRWVWGFPKHSRPAIIEALNRAVSDGGKQVYQLGTRRELKQFMDSLR